MFGNSIKMELDIKKEGFLWLSQENYKGWRAYLNGKRVTLQQMPSKMFSLFLPQGHAELVLRYRSITPFRIFLTALIVVSVTAGYFFLIYQDFSRLVALLPSFS